MISINGKFAFLDSNGEPITPLFRLGNVLKLQDGREVTKPKFMLESELNALGVYAVVDSRIDKKDYQSIGTNSYIFNTETKQIEWTCSYVDMDIEAYKAQKKELCYAIAKRLLDGQSSKWSEVELSDWSNLKRDIAQYNLDASIGYFLQASADRSDYTPETLATAFTAKIELENYIISKRTEAKLAIASALTYEDTPILNDSYFLPPVEPITQDPFIEGEI